MVVLRVVQSQSLLSSPEEPDQDTFTQGHRSCKRDTKFLLLEEEIKMVEDDDDDEEDDNRSLRRRRTGYTASLRNSFPLSETVFHTLFHTSPLLLFFHSMCILLACCCYCCSS